MIHNTIGSVNERVYGKYLKGTTVVERRRIGANDVEKGVNSSLQRTGPTVSKISYNCITHDENSGDRLSTRRRLYF